MTEQTTTTALDVKKVEAIEKLAHPLLVQAQELAVDSPAAINVATGWIGDARAKIKEIEIVFKPAKEAAKKAHSEMCDLEKKAKALWENINRVLTDKANAYINECDRLRKIEEQKAREQAEKDAAKEREKLLKQAERAEAKGKTDLAEELLTQAVEYVPDAIAVAPIIDNIVRTDSGSVSQKTEWEIILPENPADIKAFCQGVVDGKIPTGAVDFKLQVIKNWAKASDIVGKHNGMTIYKKRIGAFRAA